MIRFLAILLLLFPLAAQAQLAVGQTRDFSHITINSFTGSAGTHLDATSGNFVAARTDGYDPDHLEVDGSGGLRVEQGANESSGGFSYVRTGNQRDIGQVSLFRLAALGAAINRPLMRFLIGTQAADDSYYGVELDGTSGGNYSTHTWFRGGSGITGMGTISIGGTVPTSGVAYVVLEIDPRYSTTTAHHVGFYMGTSLASMRCESWLIVTSGSGMTSSSESSTDGAVEFETGGYMGFLYSQNTETSTATLLTGFGNGIDGNTPTEYWTDGTVASAASMYSSAAEGDIVAIPYGTFAWSSQLALSGKAVTLRGQGAREYLGHATNAVAVGTGAKVFNAMATDYAITGGQTLRIIRLLTEGTGVGEPTREWMEGTVTSYISGTLTMDITSTSGSGTWAHPVWTFWTAPQTQITHNHSDYILGITRDTSDAVIIEGIHWQHGTGTASIIDLAGTAASIPIIVRSNSFFINPPLGGITARVKGDLYHDNHFLFEHFADEGLCIQFKDTGGVYNGTGWTTTSTMGDSDTTGLNNSYVEDSSFHGGINALDIDDNMRVVSRFNIYNHVGNVCHGPDTSNYGARHFELRDNTGIFYNMGASSFNTQWWHWFRGGTGIVANNNWPDMASSEWGDDPAVFFTAQMLSRNGGPNACFSADDGGTPNYPAPRQVGRGYVDGSVGTFEDGDMVTRYRGDLEPIYIWGNGNEDVAIGGDYGECTNPDDATDYIQVNRDYYLAEKDGFFPYTYPHPLTGKDEIDQGYSAPEAGPSLGAGITFGPGISFTP